MKSTQQKNNRRNQQLNIRITAEEKTKLTQLAKHNGVNLSTYLINCGLRRKLPIVDADTQYLLTQIMYELNQIGNNFNQLTKTCHLSRKLGEPVIVDNSILVRLQNILITVHQTQKTLTNSS